MTRLTDQISVKTENSDQPVSGNYDSASKTWTFSLDVATHPPGTKFWFSVQERSAEGPAGGHGYLNEGETLIAFDDQANGFAWNPPIADVERQRSIKPIRVMLRAEGPQPSLRIRGGGTPEDWDKPGRTGKYDKGNGTWVFSLAPPRFPVGSEFKVHRASDNAYGPPLHNAIVCPGLTELDFDEQAGKFWEAGPQERAAHFAATAASKGTRRQATPPTRQGDHRSDGEQALSTEVDTGGRTSPAVPDRSDMTAEEGAVMRAGELLADGDFTEPDAGSAIALFESGSRGRPKKSWYLTRRAEASTASARRYAGKRYLQLRLDRGATLEQVLSAKQSGVALNARLRVISGKLEISLSEGQRRVARKDVSRAGRPHWVTGTTPSAVDRITLRAGADNTVVSLWTVSLKLAAADGRPSTQSRPSASATPGANKTLARPSATVSQATERRALSRPANKPVSPVGTRALGGVGGGGNGPPFNPPEDPGISLGPVVSAVAGVPFQVGGSYSTGLGPGLPGKQDPDTVDSITVTAPGGPTLKVENVTWAAAKWSATVTIPAPQPTKLVAEITAHYDLQIGGSGESQVVGPFPVYHPPLLLSLGYTTSNSLTWQALVQASSAVGVGAAGVSVDGGITWTYLASQGNNAWSGPVRLPVTNPVPPQGTPVNLKLGGFDAFQPITGSPPTQQDAQITAGDNTKPQMTWLTPTDGTVVATTTAGGDQGSTDIVVSAADDLNGVVSAGIASAAYSIDGGPFQPLNQGPDSNGNQVWRTQAPVTLQGIGAHTLQVQCTDKANPPNVGVSTMVVPLQETVSLTTTQQDYLVDLVNYAHNRLLLSVGGAPVTGADLSTALCQPIARLTGTDGQPRVPAAVASAPINAVRGAIEVLRTYLAAAVVADSDYPATAYQSMLTALGTSLEELRAARGAGPTTRAALAGRLGFNLSPVRPDELDQMLIGLADVSEAQLEVLFGLQRTDTDPLTPSTATPQLLGWRQRQLRTGWASEDHATADTADYTAPVIDPSIVAQVDLLNPVTGQPAYDIWTDRTNWVQTRTSALQTILATAANHSAALTAMLDQALPGFDLQQTADKSAAGYEVSADLTDQQLDRAGFNRLLAVSALAPGGLTVDEWDDVYGILVQAQKIRQFPAWRGVEQQAGILLDPDVFNPNAMAPALPAWLGSPAQRASWQDRLSARVEQLANLQAELSSAVAATEQAALPPLRSHLLTQVADPVSLSRKLCLDLQGGPQLATSRLDQAIESMQGLLASIDAGGGLNSLQLPWVVQLPGGYADLDSVFGETNTWMGQYSSWVSAMNVFLYPESHILPSTRANTEMSHAFQDLLSSLNEKSASLTDLSARDLALTYWNYATWDGAPPDHTWWPSWPPTETLTERQLITLRQTETTQMASAATFAEIESQKREVFFDVPMVLALALSQAGQWRSALDWLRVILDRNQPPPTGGGPDQRQIFAGFALEPTSETISRSNTWLNGGTLDAHAIAVQRAHAYLRFTLLTISTVLCDWADAEFSSDTAESRAFAANLYNQALDVLSDGRLKPPTGLDPNPDLQALTLRASSGIDRLRTGLNISGLRRPLAGIGQDNSSVAPAPTNYRYSTLIARAQQLITLASQMEASYLASLQQQESEQYQQLLAQQDLGVAGANVTIAADQVVAAAGDVVVAQNQVQKAQGQSETYASWIAAGPNQYEQDQLNQIATEQQYQGWATQAQVAAAVLNGAGQAAQAAVSSFGLGSALDLAGAIANTIGIQNAGMAQQAGLQAQVDALQGSFERTQQQWQLQKQSADEDVAIGQQQVVSASARQQVATDQATLAGLTQQNAQVKLQFLQTKLLNAQLYQWMAGVLGGVYRYLLQRAAAVAKLAEQQLAFERQAAVPGYIKSDYWSAPSGGSAPSTGTDGLTGSARLLEDITQLDQYADDTNTRKLQLTQTFSLATLVPTGLQRFRETGVLPFSIPLSNFGPPGTYLATVRTVRVSLAALIPPVVGIRGTLTGGGTSHIVVPAGASFSTVTVARPPETIVLTTPAGASGVFSVDLTPDLELPWEGCGPDLTFELVLPQAINQFDYRTIADVQISMDYTALYSSEYADRVIRELPARTSNSLALSLRDFSDTWYQLISQAQSALNANPTPADPLVARWNVTADFLPCNLTAFAVEQITFMAVRDSDSELSVDHLTLNGIPADPATPTGAKTVQQIVSTRNGSGAAWSSSSVLVGPSASPIGTWEIGLVADQPTITAVANGDIQDLVLVLSYGATLPPWPS